MFKVLFCCFMKSAAEPIHIDLVARPKSPVAYRPDSVQPFTEKDLQFFQEIRRQKLESCDK